MQVLRELIEFLILLKKESSFTKGALPPADCQNIPKEIPKLIIPEEAIQVFANRCVLEKGSHPDVINTIKKAVVENKEYADLYAHLVSVTGSEELVTLGRAPVDDPTSYKQYVALKLNQHARKILESQGSYWFVREITNGTHCTVASLIPLVRKAVLSNDKNSYEILKEELKEEVEQLNRAQKMDEKSDKKIKLEFTERSKKHFEAMRFSKRTER